MTVNHTERNTKIFAVLMAALGLALLMAPQAFAEFTRPYMTQLTGSPTGPGGQQVPFGKDGLKDSAGFIDHGFLGGLAVDSLGDVYVGEKGEEPLADGENPFSLVDEFDSSSAFVEQIASLETISLAYDETSGKLFGSPYNEYVAVDNSANLTDEARGDVYFADGANVGSVRRISASGSEAPFTCPEGIKDKYINGGGELVGKKGELWIDPSFSTLFGIAVDSGSGGPGDVPGDFYVVNGTFYVRHEVDQFTSAGCFVQAFSEAGVPLKPFRGTLSGVAVDPTDGDVVVETEVSQENGTADVIDELTSSDEYLGQITGASKSAHFIQGAFSARGIAVGFSGDLYVNLCENYTRTGLECEKSVVDEFGPGAFYPTAVTDGVSGVQSGSAVLNGIVRGVARKEEKEGHVVEKNLEVTGCEFEFVTEGAFKQSVSEGNDGFSVVEPKDRVPCVLGSESSPVGERLSEEDNAVHGEATGLKPGEVYKYRLVVATNQSLSERGGVKEGEVASFAAVATPRVEEVSVGGVSSSFADFTARIDPRGAETTYHFEYVDASGYEAAVAEGAADPYAAGGVVPVPTGAIDAGDGGVSVSVEARGLSPGTVYDYRVVASNEAGVTDGVDGVFATVPTGPRGLPDGREYELVTPVNKGDAEEMFGGPPGPEAEHDHEAFENFDWGYASEEGNQFLLQVTHVAFGSFPGSGAGSYVFSRGKGGWSFKADASPQLGVQSADVRLFDPFDFSVLGVNDQVGSQAERELGLVGPAGSLLCESPASSGCYRTAISGVHEGFELAGASQDLSNVVIESPDHGLPLCESAQEGLANELSAGSRGLYEWSAVRGCLSLVDVASDSEGGGLVSTCGAVLGLGPEGDTTATGSTHNAVSRDGSKIFFTAPDPKATGLPSRCWEEGSGKVPPQLYVRLHGETTLQVSKPEQGGELKPGYPALYVGASEDGSKVFFLTRSELTAEAVKLGGHEPELYECEIVEEAGSARCQLTRISGVDSGEIEGKVADVPAISADGSTVYLNAEGGLYGYDTVTGSLTFVAPEQSYPGKGHGGGIGDPWYAPAGREEIKDEVLAGLDVQAPYYTTRNGKFLLFGDYRYDAELPVSSSNPVNPVCVICNPDGSGPIPEPEASFTRSAVRGENPAGGPPHAMSENGEYVFFDTTESLVPQDTNGTLDVYEWEADSAGSCTETKGCISLISSGEDPHPSFFLDASSYVNSRGETIEGGNVFFGSHANLVPSLDTASESNLYDARIEGGFPASVAAGPCEGDACDNPPPPPADQTPASLTFTGPGNPASESSLPPGGGSGKGPSTKCKKPKKLSHGKCVKVRKKKVKAKKASHDRRAR